jgi:hypothetical protein
MQPGRRRPSRRIITSVSLALALVSLFFLLQVAPHEHAAGQDDPACRVCQVAHIGIAPAITAVLLSLTLLYFGETPALVSLHFSESFFAPSRSRAPPAPFA